MIESAFFQDLAMLMTVASVAAVIFARLKWPKVFGYILAGVIMSDHTWGGGFLVDVTSIRTFGQLGVVFLMFAMGLSFSPREMKKMRGVVVPCAIADSLVMIWLGYTLGVRIFHWPSIPSFFLGVAICDSATTLLAKVIDEMGWANRPFAKYVLGTSVCEDIVCVGAIAVATGFAGGQGMSAGALLTSLGWLCVFFLSVLVFGLILVPRLLASVGRRHDEEALLLLMLGCCFAVSYLAYRFDFSLALGAFLIGLVGSTSDARDRLDTLVAPLKSMFSAIFFVSIGLLVNPAALWSYMPQILIVSAIVLIAKTLNNAVVSLAAGVDVRTSVQMGMGLAQIGEFAFMVAMLYAALLNDSDTPMFQIAVGASLLTTLLNPLMIRFSGPAGEWLDLHLPARVHEGLAAYRAWLEKIRHTGNAPALLLLKAAAMRLGVYAVLVLAVSAVCAMVPRFDFSRFSVLFERYDEKAFFMLANLFAMSLMPLVISASRAFADEIAVLLGGDGSGRWQQSLRQIVRYVALAATMVLFFLEWAMINVATVPSGGGVRWGTFAVIVGVGVAGWRFFLRMGRRATKNFREALSAEERREGLVKTMTIDVPEGVINRFALPPSSPAIGLSVMALSVRAKTGATIVSVYRNGKITRNIGPDWEFQIGDVLVAIGEQSQIAALKDLMGIMS